MISIFWKEISTFFSSLIGYMVIAVFLIFIGSFTWVFQDTSILQYNYAGLDPLFVFAPMVFLFLIPAITMRSFSEEFQNGTMEFLATKPVSDWQIVLGKYLANLVLVMFALLPTLVYYYSVYQLGLPKGNLDSGGIIGSYIGLFFLASLFVALGLFASTLSKNQIVAFIIGAFLCFFVHWGIGFIADFPDFIGTWDDVLGRMGSDHHYNSLSKGVLDSRDVIYFLSFVVFALMLSITSIGKRNW